jgi:hypothetical protein
MEFSGAGRETLGWSDQKGRTWQRFGCLFVRWHGRSSVENRVGLGMFCTIQADVGAVVKHGLQGVKSSNSCAIANICAVDRLNPQMYTER